MADNPDLPLGEWRSRWGDNFRSCRRLGCSRAIRLTRNMTLKRSYLLSVVEARTAMKW